jgi:Na+/pantothenate symporter
MMLAASAGTGSNAALVSFCVYTLIVFALAWLAGRKREGKSFMNEYFLGSRNLGMWAFALTYAATSASGGSFMGFPAKIYTYGWVMALWIGGYIVVPLVAMGLISKRLNQVARKSGSITVPEMMRKRLGSATVGQVATVLLVFFQFFFLLAQFKAGAKIMTTLLGDVSVFIAAKDAIEAALQPIPWLGGSGVDGAYYLCLLVFAVSVVAYTAWGGFRAVVWTDVMQGMVMLVGVVILLGLALTQVGGLAHATRAVAQMVPPENGVLRMEVSGKTKLPQGTWFKLENGGRVKYFRVKQDTDVSPATDGGEREVEVICLPQPTREESKAIERQLAEQTVAAIPFVYKKKSEYKYGAGKQGVYVSAPGPSSVEAQGFLPVMMAMCFFAFWPFAGSGQPSYMARQMAFKDTVTLRRSMVFVMVYFSLIYFPLIIIFTCSRVLLPGWEIDSDRIMPEMAMLLTSNAGAPWLAGLLLAAPFAAVMSSVDSFLLLFSSSITRDVYQQKNPDASEAKLKKVSYAVTIIMGVLAVVAMLKPPQFLQDLIVFGSGGLAASFLMPVVLMLYWPRLSPVAAVAGMVSGGFTIGVIYLVGFFVHGKFGEINLLGLHPFIWAVAVSALVSVLGVRFSRPTDPALVEKYFGKVDGEGEIG